MPVDLFRTHADAWKEADDQARKAVLMVLIQAYNQCLQAQMTASAKKQRGLAGDMRRLGVAYSAAIGVLMGTAR